MAKQPKQTQAEKPETQDEYRQRIMSLICALMAEGQSLRRICASVEGMPKHSTVCGWLIDNKPLADQYARARDILSDYNFDGVQDLAADIVKKYLAEGWEPKDAVKMAHLEVDKEKWRISKMAPKKYGDKIEQTLQNPDGSALTIQVVKFGDS
jgi:hypothetical protein